MLLIELVSISNMGFHKPRHASARGHTVYSCCFFKSHNSLTLSFPGDRLSACQHECSRDPSSCPITGNQYDLLEKSIGVKGHPR